MRNPLWRLKTLPWILLLQNALLTVVLATLLDILLLFVLSLLAGIGSSDTAFALLGGGVGSTLLVLIAAGGMGALSIILMERFFRNVMPDGAILWALVACLALILYIRSFLPIPFILIGFSQLQLVGMMLGLFAQGRRYWRY